MIHLFVGITIFFPLTRMFWGFFWTIRSILDLISLIFFFDILKKPKTKEETSDYIYIVKCNIAI